MTRQWVQSGTPWESVVGYSRAIRIGDHVHVSGTTPMGDDGAVVGKGDAYAQTAKAIENVRVALEKAGATLDDVYRTRMFVTDIGLWQEYGRAHGEYFGESRPAATMVEVQRLIDPDMLIEIEVDAQIGSGNPAL